MCITMSSFLGYDLKVTFQVSFFYFISTTSKTYFCTVVNVMGNHSCSNNLLMVLCGQTFSAGHCKALITISLLQVRPYLTFNCYTFVHRKLEQAYPIHIEN